MARSGHWYHDDVIKLKRFPRYWLFVWGFHRSPVNSPHKRQWRRALMFSLICAWIYGWVNNGEAGDLRRHRAHYDVTVMHLATRIQLISLAVCCNIGYSPETHPPKTSSSQIPHYVFSCSIVLLPCFMGNFKRFTKMTERDFARFMLKTIFRWIYVLQQIPDSKTCNSARPPFTKKTPLYCYKHKMVHRFLMGIPMSVRRRHFSKYRFWSKRAP